MNEVDLRCGADDEIILRFLFQKGHIRGTVKKQGVNVAPHPKTGRFELSVFLLEALTCSDFWSDMSALGNNNARDAVGYGHALCKEVRSLCLPDSELPIGLNVEVNNDPHEGHCDVINWSDDAEARMSQQIEFAKLLNPQKKPKDEGEMTPEHKALCN